MSDTVLNGDITVYYSTENNQKRLEWTGSSTGTRTLNETYSALQSLFDDPSQMDDKVPMKADTPDIYRIQNQWFIDDTTVEHLTGGSIFSDKWIDGSTEHVLIHKYSQTTEFVPSDIGRTIVGGTTGDTGTVLDYNTSRKLVWIRPDDPATSGDEFDDNEAYTMLNDTIDACIQDENASYTDETADANSVGNADVQIINGTPTTNSRGLIGSGDKFSKVVFDYANGTAGIGGTHQWQYWDGSAWTQFTPSTDDTSFFTAAASDGLELIFTPPIDWAKTTINGQGPYYYIRIESSGGEYTTAPVLDQVFIGGAGVGTFDETSRAGESSWVGLTSIGTIEANSHVYIYQQDPDQLGGHDNQISVVATKGSSDWWGDGQIDILLKTKEAGKVIGPDPQTPANALATFFVRQYSKTGSHFVASSLATSGGNTVVPFASGDDLNNTTGFRNLVWDAGATDDTLVDEELLYKMGTTTAGNLDSFVTDDGGSFVDDTTDANNSTANDVQPIPTTGASGDAFYIGKNNTFNYVLFDVGTAGTDGGSLDVQWEYYNGSSWSAVSDLIDDTASGADKPFLNSGRNRVSFTLPSDWARTSITNQPSGFDSGLFYIRGRLNAGDYGTDPLLSLVWVAGEAQLTARVADTTITTPAGATGNTNYYLLGDPISDFSNNDVVIARTSGKDFDINGAPTNVGPATTPDSNITVTFGQFIRDINNGNGERPYSVDIDQVNNTLTLGDVYERMKYVTRRGSSTNLDGINGEEYLGNELQIEYTGQSGGFSEGSLIYDQTTKAKGVIVADHDDGTTGDLILRNVKGSFTAGNVIADAPSTTQTLQATLQDDGGSITSTDTNPFPAAEAINDAFYIGSNEVFTQIAYTINTSGVSSADATQWEYWNGTAWSDLEAIGGFTDNGNSANGAFTASGAQTTVFTVPPDWAKTVIGPDLEPIAYYYVRVRITAANYSTIPTLTTSTIVLTDNATATISSIRAITPVSAAPFGTFAGGKFFGAPGIAFNLSNLNSTDVQNYQLIDDNGSTQIPPNVQSIKVSNLFSGDTVAAYRRSGTDVIKDIASGGVEGTSFFVSHATNNVQGDTTLVVQSAGAPIPADFPTTGKVKIKTSGGTEHRYRYTSVTTTNTTDDTFTLATASTGTATGGDTNTLTDSGADFTGDGVEVGDYIRNTTTGEIARVVTVTDGTNLETDAIVGAGGNGWNGDGYAINNLVQTYDSTDTIYVPFLEQIATSTEHNASFTYGSDIDVKVVVRRTAATTILPFEADQTILSTGLTVPAIRTPDEIFS